MNDISYNLDWQALYQSILENKESIREAARKMSKEMKELKESQKESQKKTDEQIKKTSEQMKKTHQETEEEIKKLSKLIGSHTNNVGDVTEEFFFKGLSKKKKLGNIQYDHIRKNLGEAEGKEYDIVMVNGDSVAVISVKYKLHDNDIDKFFEKDLQEFKTYFPELKNYRLYGGIASKFITRKQKEKIKDLGLFAISQAGKDVEVLDEEEFDARVI